MNSASKDVAIPRDRVRDPRELREPGLGLGRDPQRTPMPWDGSPNAGFTTGEPWLPLNADWRERNVEALGARCMLDPEPLPTPTRTTPDAPAAEHRGHFAAEDARAILLPMSGGPATRACWSP